MLNVAEPFKYTHICTHARAHTHAEKNRRLNVRNVQHVQQTRQQAGNLRSLVKSRITKGKPKQRTTCARMRAASRCVRPTFAHVATRSRFRRNGAEAGCGAVWAETGEQEQGTKGGVNDG